MDIQTIFGPGSSSVNTAREVRTEEDEEEFRSCCEDEDELKEREESAKERLQNNLDDVSVNMFFKGVSMAGSGEFGAGLSGIGVVMERSDKVPPIQVQKKLDFYVDESVVNYLALMDGLLEAAGNKIKRVFAFTDSEILYDQIVNGKKLENPLLQALGQRILEHAEDLEDFVLHLAPIIDLERPLRLAQVAIGVVSFLAEGDEPFENCSICCEEKPIQMMITMKCSHKFCSHCMKTYVDGKVLSAQVPITLHRLAQNKRWRRCQQCRRMIELTHGCYHMTCWCGHEFCYSCGAGYREGQQTCQCAFWDEENSEDLVAYPTQESEQWAWDSFDSIPTIMDAYTEQERSQLLLIQRFLAGGFSLSDQHPYQSPPRCTDSYVDAMKDIHQLPWLESDHACK